MQIVKYPHPTLRRKSKDLRRVDAELRKIVREMFESDVRRQGDRPVGQPGRFAVPAVRVQSVGRAAAADQECVFINPVISRQTGMAESEEGCLSFPGIYAPVKRPEKIAISAYDLAGEERHYELDGLWARAAQHEYDHLDGKLFIDRLSESHRLAIQDALDDLVPSVRGGAATGRDSRRPADRGPARRVGKPADVRLTMNQFPANQAVGYASA